MTHTPPFSWVSQEEGIQAMKKFNGDANKAADYIMNNKARVWKYGPGNDQNVIKKWLDRIYCEPHKLDQQKILERLMGFL